MGRYLKGNLGTETPSNFIFFDTETWHSPYKGAFPGKRHSLRLWCAIRVRLEKGKSTRRKEEHGFDSESFWRFVFDNSDEDRTTWIIAHNLPFDLTQVGFWQKMDCGVFTIQRQKSSKRTDGDSSTKSRMGTLCLENRPTYLRIFSQRQAFVLADSGNYWPSKLAEIGDSHGLPKGELPTIVNSEQYWLDYCQRDVEILEVAVVNLVNRWRQDDAGVFQPTAAGLSMNNFRHTCPIRVPGTDQLDIVSQPDEKQCQLERDSYFGGRFQAFTIGKVERRVYKIDCNSLYPFVMRENSFPRRFINFERKPSHATAIASSEVYGTVARLTVNARGNHYPLRVDGQQYHCTGIFSCSLAGPELSRCLSSGDAGNIELIQRYSIAPIFRQWVDHWYARKVRASKHFDNDAGEYEYCKLILNSMSGKWAQTGRRWVDLPGTYPIVRWGAYCHTDGKSGNSTSRRGIGGNCQEQRTSGDPAHSFPLISSYITSYAREYMLEAIESAGPHHVHYMATDSLIVDEIGFIRLQNAGYIHDWQLGKFKVEQISDGCEIRGPNYYTMGGRSVIAGPYANARRSDNGAMETDLWEQIGSIIAAGPRRDIVVQSVPIREPIANNKGNIDSSGRWSPYWITSEPLCSDRLKKSEYYYSDASGMVEVRTPPNVSV